MSEIIVLFHYYKERKTVIVKTCLFLSQSNIFFLIR